ncbi:LexA family protein [Pseudomonas sp. NPDC079086]|uniref:LexA family protein n=1 Tax=unclassified Pseudomonas TaxID=196821 RepID=UPI0037C7EB3A
MFILYSYLQPYDRHPWPHSSLDELVNVRAPSVYLVRAGGDSLTGVDIFDGDVLVVDRAAVANPGEVVIALIEGEFTARSASALPVLRRPAAAPRRGLRNGYTCAPAP